MSNINVTRRAAFLGLGALAAAGLSACNTTQPAAVAGAPAAPAAVAGYRISSVVVDTSPVVGQSGASTAQWAQDAMPAAVAQAFRSHMSPGDPSGGTLSVVINSIYLGGGGPADADRISGVASFKGRQITVNATSTWFPTPSDQALVEQSMQNRVNSLAVAFAYRLKKKVGS